MPKFKSHDSVMVRLDAENAPEEARGKEGIVMALDPSHVGFRALGKSYETVDDDAIVWQVYFPGLGSTLPIHEAWLDHRH